MIDRAYKFGCRTPDNERLALQLLGQAFHYRSDLTHVENTFRRELKEAQYFVDDDSHIVEWLKFLRDAQIRAASTVTAKRSASKHFYEQFKALRTVCDDNAHVIAWIYEKRHAGKREVRAKEHRGHLVDHGTYWLIEEAHAKSVETTPLRDRVLTTRWDGSGVIGAAIASNTKFSAAGKWTHGRVRLSEPDQKGYATLAIGVGPASAMQWISWPIKLHREFPDGAIVKRVAVQRVRNGSRFRWEALVTVAIPDVERDENAVGVVGLDIGWRLEGSRGMRVATYAGDDDVGALFTDVLESFYYADEVKSTRDKHFDEAKLYAKQKGLKNTAHAEQWRDKDRLRRLATHDFGVAWWAYRDKHLEDIESGVRARAIRRRTDQYRKFADTLAKKYQYLALEDMFMSDWVNEGDTHAKERVRTTAALSLLQTTLVQRFGKERVCWIPPAFTSRTCHSCNHIRETGIGAASHWTCDNCGVEHQRDENAANVIRRHCEQWLADGNPVRARKSKPAKPNTNEEVDHDSPAVSSIDPAPARETLPKAA